MDRKSRKRATTILRRGIANDQDLAECMTLVHFTIENGGMAETRKLLMQASPKNFAHLPIAHVASVVHFNCGDFRTAADLLEICTMAQPGDAELHNDFGQALHKAGRVNDAITAFRRALSLMPSYVDALNNLGNAFSSNGEYDEAEACYVKALKITPGNARLLYNFGALKLKMGDFPASAKLTVAALDSGYGHVDALANLANAQMQLGDREAAEKTLAIGQSVQPTTAAYLLATAMLVDRMHETQKRDDIVLRALELDSENQDALVMRAQGLNEARDYEAVIALASSARLTGLHRARMRDNLYYARQHACAWGEDLVELSAELDKIILDNPQRGIEPPLQTISRTMDATVARRCGEAWTVPLTTMARMHGELNP